MWRQNFGSHNRVDDNIALVTSSFLLLLALVLATFPLGSSAKAQDARSLAKMVSRNYQTLNSFEFEGCVSAPIPGTKLVLQVDTASAAADLGYVLSKDKDSNRFGMRLYRKIGIMNLKGQTQLFSLGQTSMPTHWIEYRKLAEGIKSAKLRGREILQVGGKNIDCTLLEIEYDQPAWRPEERKFRYWIDTDRFLVLKQSFSEYQRQSGKLNLWNWTYQVGTIKLNQGAPEWLAEALNRKDSPDQDGSHWIGITPKDFALLDLDGRRQQLTEQHGKVTLIVFWATWCEPCNSEVPVLNRIAEDALYHDKGPVEIWMVSSEKLSALKQWSKTHTINLILLHDSTGKIIEDYDVQGVPTLVIVGRDGKIRARHSGFQSESDLRAAVESAL